MSEIEREELAERAAWDEAVRLTAEVRESFAAGSDEHDAAVEAEDRAQRQYEAGATVGDMARTPPRRDPLRSPEWVRGMEQLNELAAQTEALRDTLRVALNAEAVEALQEMAAASATYYDRVLRPAVGALDRVRNAWRSDMPENWQELEGTELEIIDFVKASGLCLVWAPRPQVIRALLDADDEAERARVLAENADAILDDLDAVLAASEGCGIDGQADACAFAVDALTSARAGHFNGAQALAACGLARVIHASFGLSFGAARDKFEKFDLEEATMMVLKIGVLEVCTAHALKQYRPVGAADLPDGYNRHATQHGERATFSQENALAAMLLLVGWVRQLKRLEERRPQLEAAA